MSDIAKHLRIFKTNIDDDFVTKRSSAIKIIEEAFKKKKTVDYPFELTNALLAGTSDPKVLNLEIKETVSKAIKKVSSSFVSEGEEIQILTCALIAQLEYLSKEKRLKQSRLATVDIHALTIWNSFSFYNFSKGKSKLEALVNELRDQASRIVQEVSNSSRDRHKVDFPKNVEGNEDVTNLGNLVKSYEPVVTGLINNAVLDREEIDMLWWLVNDWSEIGECRFEKLNETEAALFKGIEVSKFLRRMPSEAHKNLVIRSIDSTKQFTAKELLETLNESKEKFSNLFDGKKNIETYPLVFPLFTMLKSWNVDFNGSEVKRSLKEWGERALVEGTLMNIAKFLGDGR